MSDKYGEFFTKYCSEDDFVVTPNLMGYNKIGKVVE